MKSLAIALGIVFATAIALFGFVHWFGVSDKVAGPMAGSALGFITFIHDRVEKALSSSGRSPVTPGIVPVAFFRIPSQLMLLYIALIYIGIIEGAGVLIGGPLLYVLHGLHIQGLASTAEYGILAVSELPIVLWGIFLLGRWVGIRNAHSAYWLLPCGLLIGRILDAFGVFLSPGGWRTARSLVTDFHSGIISTIAVVLALILMTTASLIGAWRGNRIRFGAYFNSLLRAVPEPTRETLLQMAFEEASISHSSPQTTLPAG